MENIIKNVDNKKKLIKEKNEENRTLVKQLQELKEKYEESPNNNNQLNNNEENIEDNDEENMEDN